MGCVCLVCGLKRRFCGACRVGLGEDWQKVLRAGKQEGRLVIYTFPGLSTAIGLSLAFPERPVVCITGDGSFMLESQELATAAALKLPVSVIAIRNNAYGNMKRDQIRHYGGRVIGTDLHLPDLCTLATAYGIASERVIDPSALLAAIKKSVASGVPFLLDAVCPIEGL